MSDYDTPEPEMQVQPVEDDSALADAEIARRMIRTIEGGQRWPVCPCGAICKPINTWSADSYWRCTGCGHRHDVQPLTTMEVRLEDQPGVMGTILKRVLAGARDQRRPSQRRMFGEPED